MSAARDARRESPVPTPNELPDRAIHDFPLEHAEAWTPNSAANSSIGVWCPAFRLPTETAARGKLCSAPLPDSPGTEETQRARAVPSKHVSLAGVFRRPRRIAPTSPLRRGGLWIIEPIRRFPSALGWNLHPVTAGCQASVSSRRTVTDQSARTRKQSPRLPGRQRAESHPEPRVRCLVEFHVLFLFLKWTSGLPPGFSAYFSVAAVASRWPVPVSPANCRSRACSRRAKRTATEGQATPGKTSRRWC